MHILTLGILVSNDIGISKKRNEIEKETDDIINFEKKFAQVCFMLVFFIRIVLFFMRISSAKDKFTLNFSDYGPRRKSEELYFALLSMSS